MRFIVYTKPNCPWCTRAKDFLLDSGNTVEERDITSNLIHFRFFREKRFNTVPQIYRDLPEGPQHIGGYEDLLNALGATDA